MHMNEINFDASAYPPIDAYGGGGFRLGGARFEGSVFIGPQGPQAWAPRALGDLDADALAPLLALKGEVDFLLFGAGAQMAPLPLDLQNLCDEAGVGVEPMSTASACRSYNVLMAEGRRLAAALIAV